MHRSCRDARRGRGSCPAAGWSGGASHAIMCRAVGACGSGDKLGEARIELVRIGDTAVSILYFAASKK